MHKRWKNDGVENEGEAHGSWWEMRRVWLVTDDGEEEKPVWLGKISIAEDALVKGSVFEGSGQSLKEMALKFRADTT